MYIGADEHWLFARQVFIQQSIYELIGFFLIKVEVIHAVFFRADFRLVVCKSQGVCRNVDFGNDVHTILHPHPLKFCELLLGIRAVLGGKARETFTFQSEGSIGLVPVVVEELRETIVVQMDVKLVHLVERQHLDLLLQIVEGEELACHVEHISTVGEFRPVARRALRKLRFLSMKHLKQGTCSPKYTLCSGGFDAYFIINGKYIAFLTQLFIGFGKRKIDVVFLGLSGGDGVFPSHQFLQVLHQDRSSRSESGLIDRIDDYVSLDRKTESSFRSLPLPKGRDDLRTRVLCDSYQTEH